MRPTTGDVAFSPTSQRTILARQSLLRSAVFHLTEMVEDLLLASGKPRKPVLESFVTGEALPGNPDLLEIPGEVTVGTATLARPHPEGAGLALDARSTVFGASRRRRRRGGLAILAALLFLACLAWTIPNLMGAGNAGPSVPRLAHTADERLGPPRALAVPADSGAEGRIKVPDVSGQSLEHAVSSISAAGFEVAEIRREASRRDGRTAVRTEPKAGVRTRPGAPVVLTMGGGTVPAVQAASASASAYGGAQ